VATRWNRCAKRIQVTKPANLLSLNFIKSPFSSPSPSFFRLGSPRT
jgi:hypothetical protein